MSGEDVALYEGGETYYEVLGVDKSADAAAIRDAYRDTIKECHPDTGSDPDQDRFDRVLTAKKVLLDADRRKRYDTLGHETYVEHTDDGVTLDPRAFDADPVEHRVRDGRGAEKSDVYSLVRMTGGALFGRSIDDAWRGVWRRRLLVALPALAVVTGVAVFAPSQWTALTDGIDPTFQFVGTVAAVWLLLAVTGLTGRRRFEEFEAAVAESDEESEGDGADGDQDVFEAAMSAPDAGGERVPGVEWGRRGATLSGVVLVVTALGSISAPYPWTPGPEATGSWLPTGPLPPVLAEGLAVMAGPLRTGLLIAGIPAALVIFPAISAMAWHRRAGPAWVWEGVAGVALVCLAWGFVGPPIAAGVPAGFAGPLAVHDGRASPDSFLLFASVLPGIAWAGYGIVARVTSS
ncbi:hypothetical protein BRD17_00740 [Halobacteriales archaeon SW_7_68_16]|nr:MAG: hypothetical protein BRD17_00740 [Halobacteriales archaeon SW_7_68_16]